MLDPGDTQKKGRTYVRKGPLLMGETKVNKSSDHCQDGDGRNLCKAPEVRHTIGSALLSPNLQAPSLEQVTKLVQGQVLETYPRRCESLEFWSDGIASLCQT